MALFGDKKSRSNQRQEKKEKKSKDFRVYHARVTKKLDGGIANEIIHAPWFSEKSLIMTERGVYTFQIPKETSKADIAGAIKEIFNVEPRSVRIVNLPAKRKTLRTRRGFGVRSARRKAYIYLNKGDTIQFS